MRKNFCLGTVVLSSVFFLACLEEDAMPVPFPLPPPTQQSAEVALPPPPIERAEPAPVAEVRKAAPTPTVAPTPAPTPAASIFVSSATDSEQLRSGKYTIQVAVFPNEASAKKLVKKINANGINAYYVKVNNPGQLLGTYYRVRVGYFNGKSAAESFAKERLEPLGYAWYVDGRKNDTIGNPKLVAAQAAPATPAATPAISAAPAPATPAATSANAELEKAKQEYKEIAKQAQAAKPPPPPPPPKAPPPPPPPKAAPQVESNW